MTDLQKELIQGEIDGLNSTEESAALEQLLTSDASAQQAFDELSIVQSAFEALPERVPPTSLRASIMDALPEMGYGKAPAQPQISIWSSIQQLVMNPRPVSLAYAFSIGILVSFFAWSVIVTPPIDSAADSALVGTMGAAGSPIVYNQAISGDSDVGNIHATARNGQVRIEVRWTSQNPASLKIAYDPEELFATGVESVMGESSLSSLARTDAELSYDIDTASIDITTLVSVSGLTTELASVVDVWITADGLTPVQHRIPIRDMN